MVSFGEQIKILLWKNWTLRKRNKKRLVIEILWPLSLFLILMWVRTRGLKYRESSCHLIEKALPSVGGFEFVQNFICTLNNTCYDEYVENTDSNRWDDAIVVKFMKDTTPLLNDIVNTEEGRTTIVRLSKDIMDVLRIISSLSADNVTSLGSIQLRNFVNEEELVKFYEDVKTMAGLSREDADEFLNITINLEKVQLENFDALLDIFRNQNCSDSERVNELLSFSSQQSFKKFCELGQEKLVLIFYVYSNHLNRDILVNRFNVAIAANQKINELQSTMPMKAMQYDFETIQKLGRLGRKVMGVVQIFDGFSNLTVGEMASIFAYQGICGIKQQGNRTIFSFDPGLPSRFDSFREQFRDMWKSDAHYERDPEISSACNDVFQRLESMPITSFMWRQIKPIVRGFIYYAPDTEVTRMIMEKVEAEFGKLQEAEYTVNSISLVLHRVRLWVHENLEDLNRMKTFFSNQTNVDNALRIVGISLSSDEMQRVYQVSESLDAMSIEETLERIDYVAELLSEIIGCVRYNKTRPFPTEWEAVDAGHKLLSAEKLWAVIVFTNAEASNSSDNATFPPHMHYKIRMDSDKVDGTRAVRDRLTSKGPRRRPLYDIKYITFGFVYLQEMIERSYIELITGEDLSEEQVFLQQFPYPCYIVDQFIRRISRTFPMFMVLAWVYASAMIIKSIVLEKERRLREVMKIMGVSNAAVWMSWFLESFVIMFTSCSVLVLILKYGKVLEFSNPLLVWFLLISYTVTTICFSFLVSTFFSRANSAAAAGGVIFFVSHLPYNMMIIWEDRLEWFETMAGCVVSNVAFGFACTYLARLEQDGIGAQWDNLSWKTLPGDEFNLAYCIAMLWFDSILYLILAWYVEAVFPGEYGVPKPWHFCLHSSYWIPQKPLEAKRTDSESSQGRSSTCVNVGILSCAGDTYREGMEADPEGEECGVKVMNLSKTYANGKSALDNLSINFYENQITSFLGHNGAGKTTTISILTGLFPPTKGTALINGMDIRTDMDLIRRNLGICPQFNVLFDRLNVYEHLQFYALLKGKKGKEVENEFDEMLTDLGIPHKRDCYPSDLSGGMKRKLSVAIAFVGGSKTVFLDEPTSGVDPFSRRSIWELLLKYKAGRTVILTTHFMDEADILGDRIAIISQGKLKAMGSSLFLKSHFGQGYTLHMVKRENFLPRSDSVGRRVSMELQTLAMKHDLMLEQFVREVVSDAVITESVGCEIHFLLPYTALEYFSILFARLNETFESKGVLTYGISDTSLEDVFLKITMADLMINTESFNVLSSSCKRRLMSIISRCKNRMSSRNNTVTIQPIRDPSASTNTTGVSVQPFCMPGGDFARNDDVDMEERDTKYSDRSTIVASLPERRSRDVSCTDGVSSASEAEAVMASLLDDTNNSDEITTTETTFGQKKCAGSFVCCLFFIQIYMIIRKRLWNSRRNIKAMFLEIVLPAVFIAITLAFTLIIPPSSDEPPREMTPWTYPSPNIIFFAEPSKTRRQGYPQEYTTVVNELIGPVGMGTACLEDSNMIKFCDVGKWKNSTVQEFNISRQTFRGNRFPDCNCDIGSLQCPANVNDVSFPVLKTQTNDLLVDASYTNVPEWIIKTYDKYMASRYGGFEMQMRRSSPVNMAKYLALLNNLTNLLPLPKLESDRVDQDKVFPSESPPKMSPSSRRVYKVWYESRGWVSSVAYLNALHNMWLRSRLPEQYQEHKANFGITLVSHPMNLTKQQNQQENMKTAVVGLIHAICIIFALSFIPASFTVYLIEERTCGGKHLHLVSGVRPLTYWVANFIFDLGKYFVPIALCLIIFKIFDAKAYIAPESFWAFLCLLMLYGWAAIPSMYPFSFLFNIPSTAFVALACSNLFLGVISTVSTYVLELFGDKELEVIGKVLEKVFLVFPHYCLGRGCIQLITVHAMDVNLNEIMHANGNKPVLSDRFKWENLGEKLFFLAIHGFVYFALNLIFEYKQWLMIVCKLFPMRKMIPTDEDIDVTEERRRVENSNSDNNTLCAVNLTKYYKGKKHPAVNGVTFGIKKGECFGLLGVNGAGKSSTFKMLTGDARISSGMAKICRADVETSLDSARKHFGYCPQEDSIDPLLSGYELLTLYGRLRGLTATDTRIAAERLIKTLGLSRYAHRSSGTYSGGNKRKLSTAIALIGDPDVIFLDEPTSGMDPGARRDLWKVILQLLHNGKTIVLTSHSMEECEVLCTKIAIMVNGQFKCLGSLQHLKNRFGKGYTLTICCTGRKEEFLNRIHTDLPMATVEDQHCSQIKLNIPQECAQLNEIFSTLTRYKSETIIEDYSVSQTTLDDIFVRFASEQKDTLDR